MAEYKCPDCSFETDKDWQMAGHYCGGGVPVEANSTDIKLAPTSGKSPTLGDGPKQTQDGGTDNTITEYPPDWEHPDPADLNLLPADAPRDVVTDAREQAAYLRRVGPFPKAADTLDALAHAYQCAVASHEDTLQLVAELDGMLGDADDKIEEGRQAFAEAETEIRRLEQRVAELERALEVAKELIVMHCESTEARRMLAAIDAAEERE